MSLETVAINIFIFGVVLAVLSLLTIEFLKIRDLCFLKKVAADLKTRNSKMKSGHRDNLQVPPGTLLLRLPSGLTIKYHRYQLEYHDQPPITTVVVYQEGPNFFGTMLIYKAWGNKIFWPNLTPSEQALCRDILAELEFAMAF